METEQNLDFEEFKKALTPQHLLTFRVIYMALLLGATLFLGILLFMAYSKSYTDNSANSQDFLLLLTAVHVVAAISAYLFSVIFFKYITHPKNLSKFPAQPQEVNPEQKYLRIIFLAYIIRAASFEGPALFGMIICLLGATDGTIQRNPIYWLNLFSYVAMAVMIIYTFPSRTQLEDMFKNRCIPKPAHIC